MEDELFVDKAAMETDLAEGKTAADCMTPEQAYEAGYYKGCVFGMRAGVVCASLWMSRRAMAVAAMDMLIALIAKVKRPVINA